ncbi:MAG TPA: glycosyltransferase, partial [Longimicrobiales bacterium]|nr:glycosyltransferase [Longimicrobiales bacterium]
MAERTPAPLVSVVIPAFNVQTYVAEAIDSVLAQTFTDYEVIVVDDGSTDDTGRVVAAYGDRVRYVRQERAGPGRARNRGIELARGELIAFLDADDAWYPRKLEKQVALFRADPSLGLVTTGEEYFNGGSTTILYPGKRERLFGGGNVPGAIVLNSRVATPTVMAPRRVIQDLGGFEEDLRVGEDENLWVRITARYPADMVDEILVRCRLRPGSVTHDPEALLEGILVHLARLGSAYPEIRPLIQQALPRRRSRVNCDLGYWYFTQGRVPEARRAFRSSLRERWTNARAWRYLLYSLAPAPIVRRIKELRGRVTAKVGPAGTHSAAREGGVVGRRAALRVLVVDNTFTFGGAITSLAHMVRGLQAWGVECVVVSGQPAEALSGLFPGSVTHSIPLRLPWVHGDPFVDAPTREAIQALPRWKRLARSVWWRVVGDLGSAVRLARIGRRHGVALVHANNTAAIQRDAALAARLLRVPAVAHHRGLAGARYAMPKSGFRMHLAVSDAVRRSLLQVGASPEDVVVVHDAVD